MLGDNMKQKRGSRARGAQAAKSAEPGFHLHPVSYREKMSFPMQEKVLMGLHTRLFGLLYKGQMRRVLIFFRGTKGRRYINSWCKYCFPGGLGPLR